MSIERPKGRPIVSGRSVVNDDQDPHIDPYGLAMIEALCGRLQTLHYGAEDAAVKEKLGKAMEYAESIVDRYS